MQRSDARTYAITRLPCCTCPTCEKLSFTHRLRSTASARASQRIFAQAALKCVCWQSRTDQQRGYDIHLKRNLDNAFASGALCRSPRHTAATCLSCPRWGDKVFHLHASQHRGCGLSLAHRFQGSNEPLAGREAPHRAKEQQADEHRCEDLARLQTLQGRLPLPRRRFAFPA